MNKPVKGLGLLLPMSLLAAPASHAQQLPFTDPQITAVLNEVSAANQQAQAAVQSTTGGSAPQPFAGAEAQIIAAETQAGSVVAGAVAAANSTEAGMLPLPGGNPDPIDSPPVSQNRAKSDEGGTAEKQ